MRACVCVCVRVRVRVRARARALARVLVRVRVRVRVRVCDKRNREYFDIDPNSQDIDINWTFFCERLTTLINNNIPRRYTKAKTHLPWITRELIRMQRKRNKTHKKAKQTGLNSGKT